MKRLIINADDFGLTDRVCAGIVESILAGAVSSTSAMVCVPEAIENLRRWSPKLGGRVGAHLQLTGGIPCAEPLRLPSLLNADGQFPRSWRELGKLNPDEVRREWHAQMELLLSLGIKPTHIDTHHHVHRFPVVFEVYCEIAESYRIPARTLLPQMTTRLRSRGLHCAEFCETSWYGGQLTLERLIECIRRGFAICGEQATMELMCHPGFSDAELEKKSNYAAEREEELRILCSTELMDNLRELQIEVVNMLALLYQDSGVITASTSIMS